MAGTSSAAQAIACTRCSGTTKYQDQTGQTSCLQFGRDVCEGNQVLALAKCSLGKVRLQSTGCGDNGSACAAARP